MYCKHFSEEESDKLNSYIEKGEIWGKLAKKYDIAGKGKIGMRITKEIQDRRKGKYWANKERKRGSQERESWLRSQKEKHVGELSQIEEQRIEKYVEE